MLRFAAALSPLELLMVATAPRQEYFANGKKGCLVRSGCEKSSAEVGDLKLGTRLVVEEEGASSDGTARLRLSSPVAGWVSKKLTVCRTVSDAPDLKRTCADTASHKWLCTAWHASSRRAQGRRRGFGRRRFLARR